MLVLFIASALSDYGAERARAAQRILEVSRGMAGAVERELRGATASLQALALSPQLQVGDLAGFRDLAVRFVATQPKGSTLILLDATGQHLVNTRLPLGEALPKRRPEVNAATVARVFATGQPLISNLVPRQENGGPIVTAEVPVLRDGQVVYDLSLVLPAQRFETIIAAQHLPAGTVSSVFDRAGVVVARVGGDGRFVGHQAPSGVLAKMLSQPEGIVNAVSLEGVPMLAVFSHTQPSGWSVCIGTPEAMLAAPLRRSLLMSVGGGLLGLMLSTAVAAVLVGRVLAPMRALARYAGNPAEMPAVTRVGLREVDAVVAALRDSTRQRQEAMVALQALNDGLEARVRQEIAHRIHAQEKLAQAQRMEALGQLAGGIAHDFNNVLQAVIGGLSLIARRADDPAAVRRLSAMAASAADRGAAITGRLLTFARRGELKAVPIAPAPLLQNMREILAPTLGPGITVKVEADFDLPLLQADKAQLETVLVNLAVNARDAMKAGGVLTLSARVEEVSEPAGRAAQGRGDGSASLRPGRYIRLEMRDVGSGMDEATLARAAEPFFTTKAPGQGTGLGLAMARGFALQSGGGFAIASKIGRGTCVSLWLPQTRTQDAQMAPADGEAPQADRPRGAAGTHILLVDDDAMVREVVASELDARGFRVTTASDGLAALALLDARLTVDVVITDFAMPGMNGLALIEEARRRCPDLPALLLTGYAEASAETTLSAVQDRLTQLVRKPVAGDELAARAAAMRRKDA
jgi:signal transduction histidine kinase/ActR/RegA family two-component response regulator